MRKLVIFLAILSMILAVCVMQARQAPERAIEATPFVVKSAPVEKTQPLPHEVQEWLENTWRRNAPAPEAKPPVVERTAAGDARIRHEVYDADVTREGIAFRTNGAELRFSRGTAVDLRTNGSTVELMHADGVIEKLEARGEGVEQSFVFNIPVWGDIRIDGELKSDLTPRADADGVDFLRDGQAVVSYRKAVAVDAGGRTLDLPIGYENGRVSMVIPEHWLVNASWPVVLDPLFAGPTVLSTSTEGNADLSKNRFAAAHNPVDDEYLAAWYSGGTLSYQRLGSDGTPIGVAGSFTGRRPSVAWMPTAELYFLAWDDGTVISGRFLNPDGSFQNAPFPIMNVAGDVDISPAVAVGANDRSLVVGHHGSGTVYGQFVNSNGTLDGGAVNISGTGGAFGGSAGNSIEPPRIAYLASAGTFGVLCRSTGTIEYIVWGVDESTSSVSWTSTGIAGGFTRAGDICAGPDRFLVSWTLFTLNTVGGVVTWWSDAQGRFIQSNGAVGGLLSFDDTQGNPNESFEMVCSVVWSDSAGEYLVSWSKDLDSGASNDKELRAVRVDTAGATAAAVEVLDSGLASASEPVLAPGSSSRVLILGRTSSTTTLESYIYESPAVNPNPGGGTAGGGTAGGGTAGGGGTPPPSGGGRSSSSSGGCSATSGGGSAFVLVLFVLIGLSIRRRA